MIILKKNQRQAIIKRLILNQEVETQEELMRLLNEQGVCSHKATISKKICGELNIAKTYTKEGKTEVYDDCYGGSECDRKAEAIDE